MRKINCREKKVAIVLLLLSLLAILFVLRLNISSANIYYEFQFQKNEEIEQMPVELSVDISNNYDKIPINTTNRDFVLSQKVIYPIDPRALENDSIRLTFPETTKASAIQSIKVYEKINEQYFLKGILDKEDLNSGIFIDKNEITISNEITTRLASSSYQNYGIKIALIAIIAAIFLFIVFFKKNRYLYLSATIFAIIFLYFALNTHNQFLFGKSYYYNSGEQNEISISSENSMAQTFVSPRKRMTNVQFNMRFEGDAEKSETNPQALIKLIDTKTNKTIDERYLFYNEEETSVSLSTASNNSNSKDQEYELIIENISSSDSELLLQTVSESSDVIKESTLPEGTLKMTMHFDTYPVNIVATIIVLLVCVVYIIIIIFSRYLKRQSLSILSIYGIGLLIFTIQLNVMQSSLEGYWDPNAHLSFVASLEATETNFLPDYAKQNMTDHDLADTAKKLNQDNQLSGTVELIDEKTNYQGHPPLYHQLLRFLGGVKKVDDTHVYVNFTKLLWISNIIAIVSVAIWFIIGYLYIKKETIFHWVYVSIIVGSSILIYASSQLGNDVIGLLSVGLTVLALFQLSEKKYTLLNYLLLAVGISVGLLTKVNVGAVVAITTGLFFLNQLRLKNYKVIFNWKFLVTLIIYLIPFLFYIKMYLTFGTFMQTFSKIDPYAFYNGSFYKEFALRPPVKSVGEFVYWFYITLIDNFTYQPLKDSQGLLVTFWKALSRLFLVLYFLSFTVNIKKFGEKWTILRYTAFGSFIFLFNLYLNTYNRYYLDGYLGGVQGRYFLYAVPITSLVVVWGLEVMLSNKSKSIKNETNELLVIEDIKDDNFISIAMWQKHLMMLLSVIFIFGSFLMAYIF